MRSRPKHIGMLPFVVPVVFALAIGLGGCVPSSSSGPDDALTEMDKAVDEKAIEVSVFYPSGNIIAEEKVLVEDGDVPALTAMRTLFKAQPNDKDVKVTLPKAKVRSVKVREGVAWVDFDRGVLATGEGGETQQVALASIIYTLRQFDGVKAVAFTVEGKTSGTFDGKDVAEFWGDVSLGDMPWSATTTRTSN